MRIKKGDLVYSTVKPMFRYRVLKIGKRRAHIVVADATIYISYYCPVNILRKAENKSCEQ